nr:hypothetical protein [Tanacetum cinerariifolium]
LLHWRTVGPEREGRESYAFIHNAIIYALQSSGIQGRSGLLHWRTVGPEREGRESYAFIHNAIIYALQSSGIQDSVSEEYPRGYFCILPCSGFFRAGLVGAYWSVSERVIPDKGGLIDYWMKISSSRDFLGLAPSYVFIEDPMRRLCHRMIACSISSKGQAPKKETGVNLFYLHNMDLGTANRQFILALGLHTEEKMVKTGVGAYWSVSCSSTRTGTSAAATAPQHRTMSQRINKIKEEMRELWQSVVGLRGVVESSITEQTRVFTWMISCMTQLMDANGRTY